MGDPISSVGSFQSTEISQKKEKEPLSTSRKKLSKTTASEKQKKNVEGILQIKEQMLSGVLKTRLGLKSLSQSAIKEESLVMKNLRELKLTLERKAYEVGSSIIEPFSPSRAKWLDVKAIHKGYEMGTIFANVTFKGRMEAHCRNIGKKYDLKEQKDLRVGKAVLERAKDKIPGFISSTSTLPHTLTEGCCFGATLDVLTRFSRLEDHTPENFKKNALQYEKGVTPQASAIQALANCISYDFTIHGENDQKRADTFFENIFTPYLGETYVQGLLTIAPEDAETPEQKNNLVSKMRWNMFRSLEVRQFLEHLSKDPESGISHKDALALRAILSKENSYYKVIDRDLSENKDLSNHPLFAMYQALKQEGLEGTNLFEKLSQNIASNPHYTKKEKEHYTKLAEWVTDMKQHLGKGQPSKVTLAKNSIKAKDLRYYMNQHAISELMKGRARAIYQMMGYDLHEIPEFPSPIIHNDEKIFQGLDKLPPGEYYLRIAIGSGNHAIGYVKYADGSAHIFDPNWGAIRVTAEEGDHIAQFKNLLSHYPNPEDKNPNITKGVSDHRINVLRVERHNA